VGCAGCLTGTASDTADGGGTSGVGERRRLRRWIVRIVVVGAALFGLLQLVPFGWWHVNPPVTADAPWPDPASAQLARQACYDCHSNETSWLVYSYIAPMSWLVRADVQAGRTKLNFSKWDEYGDKADDEIAALVAALQAMDEGGGGHGGGDQDHSGPGSRG